MRNQLDEVAFRLSEVREKPKKRQGKRGRKYDRIIDVFCEGRTSLVRVDGTGREANYLRTQLKKVIDARQLGEQVKVSVVNKSVYLEKISS